MGSLEAVVSFACNDSDNGSWLGRATGCILTWELNDKTRTECAAELDHDDFMGGATINVNDKLMTFTIHGVDYPFKRRIHWHGNWCREGFVMKRPAWRRLVRALKHSGEWHCSASTTRMGDWFNQGTSRLGPKVPNSKDES